MKVSDVGIFQRTIDKSADWLEDIMDELNIEDDYNQAYLGLRAVLHGVRDRLMPQEAVHLASQLPLLLKGVFYDGWKISDRPIKIRTKTEFLNSIKNEYGNYPAVDPYKMCKVVFSVLKKHISEGEFRHVTGSLPGDWKDLWENNNSNL